MLGIGKFYNLLFPKDKGDKSTQHNTINITIGDGSTVKIDDITGGNNEQGEFDYGKLADEIAARLPSGFQKEFEPVRIKDTAQVDTLFSDLVSQAEDNQTHRKFQEAIEIYSDLLSKNPSSSIRYVANLNLAICYLNLSQIDNYRELSKKYLDRAAEYSEHGEEEKIHLVKAWYYLDFDDFDKARSNINKALEINPNYAKAIDILSFLRDRDGDNLIDLINETYLNEDGSLKEIFTEKASSLCAVGQLYLRNGDNESAIQYFLKANNKEPENIIALSLLGDAHLFKAIGNSDPKGLTVAEVDYDSLTEAIRYYEQTLAQAEHINVPDGIKPFLINYATALYFSGKYKEAYEKVHKAIEYGIDQDELFLVKARVETATGDYEKAYDTYDSLTSGKQHFEKAFTYLAENKYEDCITHIKGILSNAKTSAEDRIICNEILVDTLVSANHFEQAHTLLVQIHKDGKSSWRTNLTWARYYEHHEEHAKSDECLQTALVDSSYHPHAVTDSVEYFGRNSRFVDIVTLLDKVLAESGDFIHSYQDFIFFNLAKAHYFNEQYFEAIEASKHGISKGIKEATFWNILADSYLKNGNYTESAKILQLKCDTNPNDYQTVINLGNMLVRIGQVEEGFAYLSTASEMPAGANDSMLLVSMSQVAVLLGDCDKALELAVIAKDLDKDKPTSHAHPYFMALGLRCGDTDRSVRHMVDYHSNYPKQNIVKQIQTIKHDQDGEETFTEEFLEFMANSHERFSHILSHYKTGNMPLAMLAYQFRSPLNAIYNWRYIYNIHINIDSGLSEDRDKEIKQACKGKTILIDYLSLLVLSRISLLDVLLTDFDEVFVCHRTFDEIINSLQYGADRIVADIWEKIRKCPKVTLVSKIHHSDCFPDDFVEVIGEAFHDSCSYAKKTKTLFCVGDVVLRKVSSTVEVETVGVLSLIARFFIHKRISLLEIARCKSLLIQENHHFVSLDHNIIFAIAASNEFRLTDESECFFDYIFKTSPDIFSFLKVFNSVIIAILKENVSDEILCSWISKYSYTFNKLHQMAYVERKFFKSNGNFSKQTFNGKQVSGEILCNRAFYYLLTAVEILSKDSSQKQVLKQSILDGITYPELYIKYNNSIVWEAKKNAINIKEKLTEAESIENSV